MGKIKDFFKSGEFYTHLQESLDSINKKINNNTNHIKSLFNNDTKIAQEINLLKKENEFLKERINRLEDKIWNINAAVNSPGFTIIQDGEGDSLKGRKRLADETDR